MKTQIKIYAFLLTLAIYSSCKKTEQAQLVSAIEGKWKFVEIKLVDPDKDDVTLPKEGNITFKACKIGKANINFCEGILHFNGQSESKFEYQPNGDGDGQLHNINILLSPFPVNEFYLAGAQYSIDFGNNTASFEGVIYLTNEKEETESYDIIYTIQRL